MAERIVMRAPIVLLVGLTFVLGSMLLYREAMASRVPPPPDFREILEPAERKAAFLSYVHPAVVEVNRAVAEQRRWLLSTREARAERDLERRERRRLDEVAARYGVEDFDPRADEDWRRLIRRIDVVPASLALAQAANESGWGTSRFAIEANNYFGQWCFERGCGVVPRARDAGSSHEVRRFDSVLQSVEAYVRNLNTHRAFADFRRRRARARAFEQPLTGVDLAEGLVAYSSRGEEYVRDIQRLIRANHLSSSYDGPVARDAR